MSTVPVDDDGQVRLRGRKKNRHISGGCGLPEIEDVLTDRTAVEQAMFFDVEGPEWREPGHVFTWMADSEFDAQTLSTAVERELADYEQPVEYTTTDELPSTTLGKIDRQEITEECRLDSVRTPISIENSFADS